MFLIDRFFDAFAVDPRAQVSKQDDADGAGWHEDRRNHGREQSLCGKIHAHDVVQNGKGKTGCNNFFAC